MGWAGALVDALLGFLGVADVVDQARGALSPDARALLQSAREQGVVRVRFDDAGREHVRVGDDEWLAERPRDAVRAANELRVRGLLAHVRPGEFRLTDRGAAEPLDG